MTSVLQDDPDQYFSDPVDSKLNFLKINENFDPEISIKVELKAAQEHFAKLKADYLFIQTKQGVLDSIASDKVPEVVQITAQSIEYESEVKENKSKIDKVKREIREVKQRLKQVIAKLMQAYTAIEGKNKELQNVYDKENSMQARNFIRGAVKDNEEGDKYGKSHAIDMDMDSVAKCHTVLGNQTGTLLDLQGKEAEVLKKKEELNAIFTPLMQEVNDLELQVKQFESERKEKGEAINENNVNMRVQIQSFMDQHTITTGMAGYTTQLVDNRTVTVTFPSGDTYGPGFVLTFQWDVTCEKMEKATLTVVDASSCPDVNGIIARGHATKSNGTYDINFVVIEVEYRLKRWGARCASIQQIVSKGVPHLSMTWNEPSLTVTLSPQGPVTPTEIISATDYVVATIRLNPDYPSPHTTPLLTGLDRGRDSRWVQSQLDVIMDSLNADPPACMLLSYIHSLYNQLYPTAEPVVPEQKIQPMDV